MVSWIKQVKGSQKKSTPKMIILNLICLCFFYWILHKNSLLVCSNRYVVADTVSEEWRGRNTILYLSLFFNALFMIFLHGIFKHILPRLVITFKRTVFRETEDGESPCQLVTCLYPAVSSTELYFERKSACWWSFHCKKVRCMYGFIFWDYKFYKSFWKLTLFEFLLFQLHLIGKMHLILKVYSQKRRYWYETSLKHTVKTNWWQEF